MLTSHGKRAGLYSQVKRAPKAKIKRKTFETQGPAVDGSMSIDDRCALPELASLTTKGFDQKQATVGP